MNIVQVNYPAPNGEMSPRQLSQITDLVIHHSDGPWEQSALEIDAEHRAEGWCEIGYNFVIGKDGTIWAGRPLQYVPSAALGRNLESVNVCLTGDFEPGTPGFCGHPTDAQVQSLKELSVHLHRALPTIVRTIGHRDVAPMFYPGNEAEYATACPGANLYALLSEIKSYVRSQVPIH